MESQQEREFKERMAKKIAERDAQAQEEARQHAEKLRQDYLRRTGRDRMKP